MATSQKRKSTRLHTPKGIACFVHLHTPRQRTDAKGNPKGDPKYGLVMYWPRKVDLSELRAEVERVAVEKFGPKAIKMLESGKLADPFRDAEDLEDNGYPFDKPGTFINFKTTDKPGVVDADAEPIMEKSDVYSGMEARVSCRCFAYDNESKGVSFALINVQKLGDGERLSGNPNAEDDFGDAPAKGKAKPGKRPSADDDDDLL